MAQYLVFFNAYTDIATFDGDKKTCLFIGPVSVFGSVHALSMSPIVAAGEKGNVTMITTTLPSGNHFRIGKEFFKNFCIFSEDMPNMRKYIHYAEGGTRLLSYSEYGFLNYTKHTTNTVTIGILTPNTKKVHAYLEECCPKKAMGHINPNHEAIIILKKFDQNYNGFIIMAHSVEESDIGAEMIETNEAWFNYISRKQQLFAEDIVSELTDDALLNLHMIASRE